MELTLIPFSSRTPKTQTGIYLNPNSKGFVPLRISKNLQIFRELYERATFVPNETQGISRVKEGKFVFIYETPIMDYAFYESCDIVKISSDFQSFEYALGLPKGAPYAELINSFILKYRENGKLDEYWTR